MPRDVREIAHAVPERGRFWGDQHVVLPYNLGVAILSVRPGMVLNLPAKGGGEEGILAGMMPYMQGFKGIMDNAAAGEMDMLANQYTGFRRFAKLLEKLAGGIQDGIIDVPK